MYLCSMSSVKYAYILLFIFLAGSFVSVRGQNNPYKIDDSLYPIYQRATGWRTNPKCLLVADTLYVEATRKNDKKAQCLALSVPLNYYYSTTDYGRLVQSAERLKEESRTNDYLQYYYYAYTTEINWLLNHGKSLRALQKAEEMKEQAFKDQHDFGIYSCIRTMGNIYVMRGDDEMAMEYYQNALDYMLKHLPEQDPSELYINLATYYRNNTSFFQKALECDEKAIQSAKTEGSRFAAMLDKCETLYFMSRAEEFNRCYEECMSMTSRLGGYRQSTVNQLRVFKLILDGDYDQALLAADSAGSLREIYKMRRTIYLKAGNYERAYVYNDYLNTYRDSVNRQIQSSDLVELNAQIGNERIKLEAKALQFKNAELDLKNAQLELEQTKSQVELGKINSENSKLILRNQALELERLNVEAERQRVILMEEQVAARHHIITLSLVISFFFLFTCFLIFYLYKRRKSMKILQEKNNELTIARDHAEQSDKMKMYFIQNMSHEIRTPLNAIVGFSQMLSTPELDFSDEEKEEFALRIQQSSDLLTGLVEDLLDLASLESGKYTMCLKSCCCNELCRSAVATVTYRKPEDVNLYFTSEVDDDYQFVTDEKRLVQVLINFLTNAEKYTEHGEIHLHCSLVENPGKITFSVTDTGSGIPPEMAECVFERFKKLDEFKQGSGLGLNICATIAERLNGEVKLDKSYTLGARFLFILPLS